MIIIWTAERKCLSWALNGYTENDTAGGALMLAFCCTRKLLLHLIQDVMSQSPSFEVEVIGSVLQIPKMGTTTAGDEILSQNYSYCLSCPLQAAWADVGLTDLSASCSTDSAIDSAL